MKRKLEFISDSLAKRSRVDLNYDHDLVSGILKFYEGEISILRTISSEWSEHITDKFVNKKLDCLSKSKITHTQNYDLDELVLLHDEFYKYIKGIKVKKLPSVNKIKSESLKLGFDMLYFHLQYMQSSMPVVSVIIDSIQHVIKIKNPTLFKLIMDHCYDKLKNVRWHIRCRIEKIPELVGLSNDFAMYDTFLEGYKRWGLPFTKFMNTILKYHLSNELIDGWIKKNLQKIEMNCSPKHIKEIGWTLLLYQYEIPSSTALHRIVDKNLLKI